MFADLFGPFWTLFSHFGGLLEKHLFLGRTLLLRLQGYQTCAGAGMLAPGLANAVMVHHFVLGVFAQLLSHFDSLHKKLLFLGRTLPLRLWVLGTHVRKRLGRLEEQPEQLGASKPVLVQECWLQGYQTLCCCSISCSLVWWMLDGW